MRPIPLNFLTMYADLAQGFEYPEQSGSIAKRKIKGKSYVYLTTKEGATRRQRSLGPADDPGVQEEAKRITAAAERARYRRTVVSTLKQKARIPAPTLAVGRVLEAVSKAGLFRRGITLVGTAAYQTYPCTIGSYLPAAAFTTNDHKLLVAQHRATADKKQKDLRQAQELIDVLAGTDEASLQDVLDDGRSRGKAWKSAISASLRAIGREARQGMLPLPVEA